jgi:uncharacterized protein (UPF0261 family)
MSELSDRLRNADNVRTGQTAELMEDGAGELDRMEAVCLAADAFVRELVSRGDLVAFVATRDALIGVVKAWREGGK